MKPALTTRSGEKTATASARAASHEARSGKSTGATTAVGIRAARAITRPPALAVSLTTATTRAPYDGSTWAASNAARLVPVPEMRTTTVSYTHLRAHETRHDLVCRLLLE